MARQIMHDDFILLNGDTLFDQPVLERLLDALPAITLAVKEIGVRQLYRDMKVQLIGDRISVIGKLDSAR